MCYYLTNFTLLIFIALSIQSSLAVGSCVTFQNVNTTMYRIPRYLKISWETQVSGCNIINWIVHYDSTSPVRIFQARNETAGKNSTFVPVTPSFNYTVYIEAQANSGQTVRSSNVTYSAPRDKPSAAPSQFHATSIKHDSIALAWQKVDLLRKNGDVRGYRIAYRDASSGAVKYLNVVGEDSLSTTLTGLQPSHTYQIMVQCINDVSSGPFSSPMLTITTPEPPTTTTTTSTTTTTTPTTSTTTTTTTQYTTLTTKITIPTTAATTATTIRTTSISTDKATLSTVPAMTTISTLTTNPTTPKAGKTPATTTQTIQALTKSSMLPGTTYSTNQYVKQTTFKPLISNNKNATHNNSSTATAVTTNSAITKTMRSESTPQTQNVVTTTQANANHESSIKHLFTTSAVTKTPSISDVMVSTETHTNDSKENDDGLPLWAIIAIALGSALILLSIVLCCCCCPRCCAQTAVASKRDEKDTERVFRRQKMDNKNICSKPDPGKRARNYSGISLESVDDEDLENDEHIPYRKHRNPSIDSQVPLTAPGKLSHAKLSRKSKKSKAKSMPPLTDVGISIGTQYNEPVSVGTQCSDKETYRSGILSPGFPVDIETSRPVSMRTANIGSNPVGIVLRREEGIQMTPLAPLTSESSLPLGASALAGLSNFDTTPTIDTRQSRKTVPFNCQSRGTSPGLPIGHMMTSRGTSPNILTQPSFGSQSRGAPESNNSLPLHKIEHNMIYKSHVNNTDNTFIQNIYNPRRDPPTPKPPRSVIQEHAQTPRGLYDSLLDNEKESRRMITPGSDRPTFFNNIPKLDVPIPRASIVESKKDWSEC